jgi:hypothetical protein
MATVDSCRRRAIRPTATPAIRASAGMVNSEACSARPSGTKPASSTPSRTAGTCSPDRSDGATDTIANSQATALIVSRLQRAALRPRAAQAAKMPAAAPSTAQAPITKTASTPAICALRAGCMVSGTIAAAPRPAATPPISLVPAPAFEVRCDRAASPPAAAAVSANHETQASWVVHTSRVVTSTTREKLSTPSP